MALTRTITGGQATYRFQYSANTAVIDKKADQAAHYLFNMGFGNDGQSLYSSLTLAEKLAILDEHILSVIINLSKSYAANASAEAMPDYPQSVRKKAS